MKKLKNRVLIILSLWSIARLIPAILMEIIPNNIFLSTLLLCVFLPLGWRLANKISSGSHATCIRVNLGIFIYLEVNGVFSTLTTIMDDSRRSGLALEAYAFFILAMIACSAAYIGLCIYFWNKTSEKDRNAE